MDYETLLKEIKKNFNDESINDQIRIDSFRDALSKIAFYPKKEFDENTAHLFQEIAGFALRADTNKEIYKQDFK